ncbi:MAG: aspartate aminotransferase family protein [Pseudomonadota bacterium]
MGHQSAVKSVSQASVSHVMGTYGPRAFNAVRGEGAYLFDDAGRQYLDFTSGIAVTGLGHCHPALVEALSQQATQLWHCSNLFGIPGQETLAARLCDAQFADAVFFTNSGAEALECAIKIARKYQHHCGAPERFRVLTFEGSFHGRTLATIAAAGQEKLVTGFGPVMAGFDHVPLGDVEAVKAAITSETAAILIEPVLGEGGIQVVEPAFLRALRTFCDTHGLLLMFDEVQCGIGRTGTLFAHESAGVSPDVMALAKGLGGGFPLGACLATSDACAGMGPGSHGSTFGGNPLGVAVANAVLDVIDTPAFLKDVEQKGTFMRQLLTALQLDCPTVIKEVRGKGLMLGLKLGTPNTAFVEQCRDAGLLLVPAGDNVVRLLPPLIVEEAQMRAAADIIAKVAAQATGAQGLHGYKYDD